MSFVKNKPVLYLDTLFCVLECISDHFIENSIFNKILKLFIRNDYVERNYI